MSRPGSHVSVSRKDVSSRVLVAGTGRDIPALSRPVPGFSNDQGRNIDYRSSKVHTSITDLRRSTHLSLVFEGQHIHLRRSTHRSSKVDTSISEGVATHRDIDLRRATHRSSNIEGGNITPTIIRRRILSTTTILSPWSR